MSIYGRNIVTKANVLALVNDYDIFRHYCRNFNVVNQKFSSEFRNDSHPSCIIGKWGDRLFYKDFGEPGNSDVFAYMMRKYGIGFSQVLNMVNRDFDLGLSYTYPISKLPIAASTPGVTYNIEIEQLSTAPTILMVKARKWEAKDGEYWKYRYGITLDTLRKYKVVPITQYWYSGRKGHSTSITEFYAYGYFCGYTDDNRESWKIYQPYSKKNKWLSNVPGKYLQGYDELPTTDDLIIITKSMKDVMVLDQLGYSAIAPHGENFAISEDIMTTVRNRFHRVVLLYDNDDAGIKASAHLSEKYKLESIFLPEGTKDASDFVESYDYSSLSDYLNEILENDEGREGMASDNT